jgi:uncharacterized protein DUF1214
MTVHSDARERGEHDSRRSHPRGDAGRDRDVVVAGRRGFAVWPPRVLRRRARTYRLHVDPDPPAKNFWAVDVYDTQTRSLLQVPSTIWPALASNSGTLQPNDDGSYDLYFGPNAPAGKDSNWVETTPGKSWFQLFRIYGPLQPWFDQTWRLNEFEPID